MRALTLTQPWAGLVASGIKRVENRPRHMIQREDCGKVFAIHASRELRHDVMRKIIELRPDLCPDMDQPWVRLAAVTSAIIAVATLETCLVGADGEGWAHEGWPAVDFGRGLAADQRRWFFGPVGYVLRDIRALPTPVPARGYLGFWTVPPEVELAIMEQLA